MTMVSLPDALAPFIAAARNIVARSHDYPERVMSTGGLGNPADLLATDFHRLALAFDAQEGAAAAAAAVDHETLVDHLTRELGDAYDCGRVWEAWNVNTMTEEDFEPVTDRIDEIAAGILALGSLPSAPAALDRDALAKIIGDGIYGPTRQATYRHVTLPIADAIIAAHAPVQS